MDKRLDHKALLATLDAAERRDLIGKSNTRGLIHLAGHWGLTLAVATPVALELPLWPLFLLPLGILLICNFMLLHETVHQTPFSSATLNKLAGRIASLIVVLPNNWFRYFHLAHHKHTSEPDLDPELSRPKPETLLQYVRYVSGLPVWWLQLQTLVRNATGRNSDSFVPVNAQPKLVTEAQLMLVFYALLGLFILTGQTWLWRCWLLPVLLGQPFLRLYLLAEHGRCPAVANMFENTRTTFTTAMVRYLAWNMPYHCEHHAYPTVPFHKLPDLHRRAREHLATTSDGYAGFHRSYLKSLP